MNRPATLLSTRERETVMWECGRGVFKCCVERQSLVSLRTAINWGVLVAVWFYYHQLRVLVLYSQAFVLEWAVGMKLRKEEMIRCAV
jgi:hypothetical protein